MRGDGKYNNIKDEKAWYSCWYNKVGMGVVMAMEKGSG